MLIATDGNGAPTGHAGQSMHGLINRAIQDFARDSYGEAVWAAVVRRADLDFVSFEPMLTYENGVTERVVAALAAELSRRRSEVLEDIGHYLVTHARVAPLRRLLRFGGVDFVDFLHTLDDLPDWARLAVDDLALPGIALECDGAEDYRLVLTGAPRGSGHVAIGMLRAMADDYGALVLLDYAEPAEARETVRIRLLDAAHAEGRRFSLAAGGSG